MLPDDSSPLMSAFEQAELSIAQISHEGLVDLLKHFRYLQQTVLIALANGNHPIPITTHPCDPKTLVFASTARAFSVSKCAMDLATRGYPFEALVLTRILTELGEGTQFMMRNPRYIKDHFAGVIEIKHILQMSTNEDPSPPPKVFWEYWKLQSKFAHPTSQWLLVAMHARDNALDVRLLLSDPSHIENAAYGIDRALTLQYFLFRAAFFGTLAIEDQLLSRDALLFDPENIARFAATATSPKILQSAYEAISQIHAAIEDAFHKLPEQ